MKYLTKLQICICLVLCSILSKVWANGLKDYKLDADSVRNLSVASVTFKPSRNLEARHYGLQADQDLTAESLGAYYKEIDQAPFGPYIDISFEALGEVFSFESVPLSRHPAPLYVVVDENDENLSSSSLPMSTYSTTFTDSDDTEALLVVTVNPVDQSTYALIHRKNNPAIAVHTLKLAKVGFAAHQEASEKLLAMESSEQLLADEGEGYVAYNLEFDTADSCGSDDGSHSGTSGRLDNGSNTAGPLDTTDRSLHNLPYFTGCHNADTKAFASNMGVYIDYSAYTYYQGDMAGYNNFLSAAFAINSYVYYRQFRIQWFVREIRVMTSIPVGTELWNAAPGACPYTGDQLYAFRDWGNLRSDVKDRYSNWIVLTICNQSTGGIVGTAFITVLCGSAKYSVSKTYVLSGVWIIGHEVGHNFGSQHAWTYVTNGTQGSVGGIMDYNTNGKLLPTDTYAPSEYGFHMTSKDPICTHLQNRIVPANIGDSMACFTEIAVDADYSVCGNGIIEDGEECELAYGQQPGASPTCCKNCKLVENANCSVDTECCEDCRIKNRAACTTRDGQDGHCGIGPSGGECYHISLVDSLECDHVEPYGSCYLTCKTGLYIYLANETVCSYSGENVLNDGYCEVQQCLPNRYSWAEGPLNKCICKHGLTTGYHSQSINCIDRRGEIVAANLCENDTPRPAYTPCTCTSEEDMVVDDAHYI